VGRKSRKIIYLAEGDVDNYAGNLELGTAIYAAKGIYAFG
jgi:hypothetical protein